MRSASLGDLTLSRSYDQRYQVSRIQAGSLDYTYSLDQAGQVTGITGIPVSATTGGTETATISPDNNQLAATNGATARTYIHDANGNITTAGLRTYTWDALNRLVKVGAMMGKNAVNNLIGAVIVLGIILFMGNMWSSRGLTLVTKGTVPVYATQEDAMKSPAPPAIAQLSAGESVLVTKRVDVKHYLIYKVRLPDGRDGFVLDGEYTLMRDGKEAF